MADGKIRVKFEAVGAPELIAAIKALNTQTKRLGTEQQRTSTTTAKLNTQQERQVRNQNLLNASLGKGAINLAMIRAKMLLYAFAVRQATVFIGGFMKEAAAFDGVERSFKQLAFSTDLNTDSLKKFSNATKNTVSNLDIMKQSNNAMLLGVADSTDQLAEMFTISHKLAKAVGKDATFGMESLTTGIGRQSRLMLDNLGIIVIAEKAYEKYADTLKKKSSDLTDAEKKQAFLNEAMSQATEMASLLPAPLDDATDKYNKLATSLENSKVAFSQAFTALITFGDGLQLIVGLLNPERVKAYTTALGTMAIAMGIYVAQLKLAVIWQGRTGWGQIAVGIGLAIEALIRYTNIFKTTEDVTVGVGIATIKYLESLKQMKVETLEAEKAQLKIANTVLDSNNPYKVAKKSVDELSLAIKDARDNEAPIGNIQKMEKDLVVYKSIRDNVDLNNIAEVKAIAINKKKIKTIDDYIKVLGESAFTIEQFDAAQTKLNSLWNKTDEGQKEAIERNIEWMESIEVAFGKTKEFTAVLEMFREQLNKLNEDIAPFDELFKEKFSFEHEQLTTFVGAYSEMTSAITANIDARMNHELEVLRKTDAFKNASTESQIAMEKKKTDKFKQQRKIAWYAERAATIAEAGINISSAYIKALSVAPIPFMSQVVAAMGAAQMVALLGVPAPQFEQGGLIGGRRHSRGGVNINAEGGEFIMSRNAVSSIGVENLNRMNDGGGGSSSVSININGGMIDQNFVENELAEAIREATRKGADFGIS